MLMLTNALIFSAGILVGLSAMIILASMMRYSCQYTKLVCMEVLSNVFVIAVGVFALIKKMYFLLDVAIVVTLLIFLGTLAFCSLLDKRTNKNA